MFCILSRVSNLVALPLDGAGGEGLMESIEGVLRASGAEHIALHIGCRQGMPLQLQQPPAMLLCRTCALLVVVLYGRESVTVAVVLCMLQALSMKGVAAVAALQAQIWC